MWRICGLKGGEFTLSKTALVEVGRQLGFLGEEVKHRQRNTLAETVLPVVAHRLHTGFMLAVATLALPGQAATITTDITYYDHTGLWLLGQVASQRDVSTGLVQAQTSYDASTGVATKSYVFGRLVSELTYNPDGTVATEKDGGGNVTSFASWYRGVPGTVGFADGTSLGATVNEYGQILTVTDETGAVTTLSYDAMGRLSQVAYPTGDSVAWNPWNSTFRPLTSADWRPAGFVDGQWMQLQWRGNYRKITYFDAAWRPLVINEYDEANAASTGRSTSFAYDTMGRQIFQSYPTSGNAGGIQGVWSEYDALGRLTSLSKDSELGRPLTTLMTYGGAGGYNITVLDPSGGQVQTWYQTFDAPSDNLPTMVSAPEGQTTEISRDVFGKPKSIRRRNADSSVALTRSYVYNAYQQLCKTVEPEVGATAIGYDEAGNVLWQAAGVTQTGITSCDDAAAFNSGRRVDRNYDKRNRLRVLTFPDHNGDQYWTYAADGRPIQVSTTNDGGQSQTVNTYTYNKRRLLTAETTGQVDWFNKALGYGYDANGALASTTYPSGLSVTYAPNALGQPTQAGSYATGVTYYPNGGMSSFTYGNGLTHTMQQNARQLPSRVIDSGAALDTSYSYDANGNVVAIGDNLDGSRSRTMGYDGLDRLVRASSPSFGGNGAITYSYDVLDNLRTAKLHDSGGVEYLKDYNYVYDAANRLTNVANSGGGTTIGLGYDVQGNVNNKNGMLLVFDYGNRMRSGGGETYRYDAAGRRVFSGAASGNILSMYGQDGTLRWMDNGRTAKTYEYITLNGSLVAQVVTTNLPAAPALTVPSFSSSDSYNVSWTSVANATNYELQKQVGDGGAWASLYSGVALSYGVSGAVAGQYAYRVRACRQALCGNWSAVAAVAVKFAPTQAATLSLAARSPNGNYTVSWTSVAGAEGYVLEESIGGGAWAQVSGVSGLSKAFTGRAAGSYSYRVKGFNSVNSGPVSAVVSTEAYYAPASAPALSAPSLALDGNYTVSWPAVAGATKYLLEENINGTGWSPFPEQSATSRDFVGRPTSSYAYRARAGNDAGWGGYSGTITVSALQKPGAPGLTAPTTSTGSIALSWNAVATAVEYHLEQSVNGGGWALVQNDGSTTSSRSGLGSGSYGYRVTACNAAGCGAYSNVTTTAVDAPPATPTGLVAKYKILNASGTTMSIQYTVTWGAVAGATRYEATGQGSYSGTANSWVFTYSAHSPLANFQVRACTATQCSAWSAAVSATQ